jgi:hypothetical protein
LVSFLWGSPSSDLLISNKNKDYCCTGLRLKKPLTDGGALEIET